MLAVNGLRYLFNSIRNGQVNSIVEQSYNVLMMIVKSNEMISFMMSFDLNNLIFGNLNATYNFIIYLLMLIRQLLKSNEYLKTLNSVLEYRKLFELVSQDDDEQVLEISLECILILMEKNTIFTKSLEKIKSISILSQILRRSNDEAT